VAGVGLLERRVHRTVKVVRGGAEPPSGAVEVVTPEGVRVRVVAEPAPRSAAEPLRSNTAKEGGGTPAGSDATTPSEASVSPRTGQVSIEPGRTLTPEQRARLEEVRQGRAGKLLAERRPAEAERLFKEKLEEAIKDGKLEKLDPAKRAWLEVDRRRLELAFDPDTKRFRIEEAQAILAAEERNLIKPPVRRAFNEHRSSGGADYIDGDGRYWDVVRGLADPKKGADKVLEKAEPDRPGAQGENVIVDMRHLTPAQREALKHELAGRPKLAGTGEIRYLEP